MERVRKFIQQFDYTLIFLVFLLAIFSFFAIYHAQSHAENPLGLALQQLMWYGIGFVVMIGLLLFDYRQLKHLSIPLYFLGIALLIWVSVAGVEIGGSQRWVDIFGMRLQPSEIVKIFVIIAVAHLLDKVQKEQPNPLFKDDLKLTIKVGLITFIPFVIVLAQPDLGTALVFLGIIGIMLFVSGISWKVILLLIFLIVATIAGLIFLYFVNVDLFNQLIASHQLERIFGWLNPEEYQDSYGMQLLQSLLAIGSGQLSGQWITGESMEVYIPEVHTDFIFAIVAQEFGFIGASVLISIYFILIYRLVQIALTCDEPFGSYLVSGMIGMFVFQIFQNIGMAIGLTPITGLTLPFISYGGSAILTNMMAIGIALNVHMRTQKYMFD